MNGQAPPVRFALLRAGEHWPDTRLQALDVRPDGIITLAALPGLQPPSLQAPGSVAPSGLTFDRSGALFVADTEHGALIKLDLGCKEHVAANPPTSRRSGFKAPCGLAIGPHDWLFVADHTAVLVLTRELSLRDEWSDGLVQPLALAANARYLYVLDQAGPDIVRFDADGRRDSGYRPVLPAGSAPRGIALGPGDVLYVSDPASNSVLAYDSSGAALPTVTGGGLPGAIATSTEGLFVADQNSGKIAVIDFLSGSLTGTIPGFEGLVAAIAVSRSGALAIKPGLGPAYLLAMPRVARTAVGWLVAGPLDAGDGSGWHRVAVKCNTPPGTAVRLETFMSNQNHPGPGTWQPTVAVDELLDESRYLWLRVRLSTIDVARTPELIQVEAETPGDSYLQYLPAVYSRDPANAAFLDRFLELARSQLGDLEASIDGLPQLYDPATAPAAALQWLAGWLGFDVPEQLLDGTHPELIRRFLERLPWLVKRRGTAAGLREYLDAYCNVQAQIFESYRFRSVWMLDVSSRVGFDTAPVGEDAAGLIVAESIVGASGPEDAQAWGRALFQGNAHSLSVVVPCLQAPSAADRRRIQSIVEAERPAHAAYHLCFVEPRMRIGIQSMVGIDSIVAGTPAPAALDERFRLDLDARLPDDLTDSPGRIGNRDRVGIETRLG